MNETLQKCHKTKLIRNWFATRPHSSWNTGDCSQRVLRGGSWNNSPKNLRDANRNGNHVNLGNNFIGFRVARTLRSER